VTVAKAGAYRKILDDRVDEESRADRLGLEHLEDVIIATTFWEGEIFDPTVPDGSQVCSTYDSQWDYHWSGVAKARCRRPQKAALARSTVGATA
jgi:hypothetical protein